MISSTVIGNVVRDGELKQTKAGPVLAFTVASNDGKDEPATFVRCSLFGKRAESLASHIVKGKSVAVAGAMKLREYDGKNGKAQSLELRVNEFTFAGSKSGGSSGGGGGSKTSGGSFDDSDYSAPDDDTLPFN